MVEVKAVRQHYGTGGMRLPGDVYEVANGAEAQLVANGCVERVATVKAAPSPKNKMKPVPANKSDAG